MEPEYAFSDLVAACSAGKVFVERAAREDARADFKLMTEDDVLAFIAGDGLEHCSFINRKPLEKSRYPETVWVDAYKFNSGRTCGYLAFYRTPTASWIIKSFKKNDEPDSRPFVMEAALRKAGRIP